MAANDTTPLLRFRDVTYQVDSADRPLVDGVDLDVSAGEIVGLVGPSGSGKSTLLRLGNRLLSPASGRVEFDGQDIAAVDPRTHRRRVQLLLQKPVVFDGTVADNLRLAARFGQVNPPDDAAMRDLLVRAGLDADRLDQAADSLSVGQQQRLSLARSLLLGPRVLLADEPTAALDRSTASQILQTIRGLVDEDSLSVLLVGHVVGEVTQMADRLAVLIDGRLARVGPPDEVTSDPGDDDVADFLNGELKRG